MGKGVLVARRWTLVAVWLLAVSVGIGSGQPASAVGAPSYTTPATQWWGTNGRVTDSVVLGNRVYLAGGFDYIGPQTGYGVGVSGTSGAKLPTTPMIDGVVRAAVPDGAGGWYVGGSFRSVGGVYRSGVAQIDASGGLTAWAPQVKGTVLALAVVGDEVVIGGSFTQVGSTAVANLTAVDRVRGAVVPGWCATANGPVRALVAGPQGVYAAGDFTAVNGTPRGRVVRLSADTGAVDPAFSPSTNESVDALALSQDGARLYAGGKFTTVTGPARTVARGRVAAFNTAAGTVGSWAPNTNGDVVALAVDPASGDIYVGGRFTTVRGVSRWRIARITSAGALTDFRGAMSGCQVPHGTKYAHSYVPCATEVDALAVANGMLYVGGRFGTSFGLSRHNAVAYPLGSSAPTAWNPVPSGRVLVVASSGANVFVGGELTSVGGLVRRGLAALDATTGVGVPGFRADANNLPLDLELSADGRRLYVGGSFTSINGVPRSRLAAISPTTGAVLTGFVGNANNSVLALAYAGQRLYAAGQFTYVNGVRRLHVARVNPLTGAVDAGFVANTVGPTGTLRRGGMVQGLAVTPDGTKAFLGGPFTSVNGKVLPQGIAVVDGRTGAPLLRQLSGVARCKKSGPWIVHLYLSPDGRRLYGGDVCPDSIYEWDAVNLSTTTRPTGLLWRSWCNAGMQGALEVDGRFYYGSHGGDLGRGGYCWTSPANHTTVARQRLAVFSAATGALAPDAVAMNSPMGVWSITRVPAGLLVGGDFTFVGNSRQVRQGLALFPTSW